MSVTGCIIARDEAAILEEAIRSLRGAVSEVIVVDHGSRDDTAAVAQREGARVLRAQSADHELARNTYLDAVTTPWVLVLDADERLSTEAREQIPSIARDAPTDVLGVGLERFDYIGRGRWAEARIVRLFRADPRVRYFSSRAHASVVPSIEACGGRIALASAPLHHLDALLPREHERKRAHMRERLRAEIASGGMAVMRCFLALEHFALGDDEASTHELHRAFTDPPVSKDPPPNRPAFEASAGASALIGAATADLGVTAAFAFFPRVLRTGRASFGAGIGALGAVVPENVSTAAGSTDIHAVLFGPEIIARLEPLARFSTDLALGVWATHVRFEGSAVAPFTSRDDSAWTFSPTARLRVQTMFGTIGAFAESRAVQRPRSSMDDAESTLVAGYRLDRS